MEVEAAVEEEAEEEVEEVEAVRAGAGPQAIRCPLSRYTVGRTLAPAGRC